MSNILVIAITGLLGALLGYYIGRRIECHFWEEWLEGISQYGVKGWHGRLRAEGIRRGYIKDSAR